MDKDVELINTVLTAALRLQQEFYKYLNVPRLYGGNVVLYMREAHLLMVLGDAGRMLSAEELAASLEITHGAVTQLTDRLEKKGYVYRDKSPKDKRLILRGLTDKGKEAYAIHRTYDAERMAALRSRCRDFSAEELQTFVRVADRLTERFVLERSNTSEETS